MKPVRKKRAINTVLFVVGGIFFLEILSVFFDRLNEVYQYIVSSRILRTQYLPEGTPVVLYEIPNHAELTWREKIFNFGTFLRNEEALKILPNLEKLSVKRRSFYFGESDMISYDYFYNPSFYIPATIPYHKRDFEFTADMKLGFLYHMDREALARLETELLPVRNRLESLRSIFSEMEFLDANKGEASFCSDAKGCLVLILENRDAPSKSSIDAEIAFFAKEGQELYSSQIDLLSFREAIGKSDEFYLATKELAVGLAQDAPTKRWRLSCVRFSKKEFLSLLSKRIPEEHIARLELRILDPQAQSEENLLTGDSLMKGKDFRGLLKIFVVPIFL
ncbi:hypothetical protein [Candidatus Spyradosoma sp. SGI.093]|uniref:hypothetical protein n=1 Tax=Candidatus Spyradosoma sp. SGI.093 TaxID=3420583 RepID=UPI003D07C50F